MIELYSRDVSDFSRHGIVLAAESAEVNFQDNGRYDMDLTMPYNALINIDYGMIIRCPVPRQHVGEITLGTVEYWEISAGQSEVPLLKTPPYKKRVSYPNWQALRSYMQGDKVSYGEDPENPEVLKNWRCTVGHGGLSTPPPQNPSCWTQISDTTTVTSVITTLNAGDRIVKTGDFNATYMKAADTAGHEGFIQISKCTDLSESEAIVIPEQTITEQSFRITEIKKSTDGQKLSIHAEHISYDLGKVILGDCNISRATPATALLFIRGAMMTEYAGTLNTNLTEETITADFSWKNCQNAILDPKSGFLQDTTGHLFRNDLDVYILAEEEAAPRYRIAYGVNMVAVTWTGDAGDIVTRIYPTAQNPDGSTLLLPETYIDTVRTVPFMRPEVLATGLKVGSKEKQEDGSEITLDEDTVFARMREQANNRFTIDECDKATVTLEVDWEHLPETEEFKQYKALQNAAPGDWAEVLDGPMGINENIQLTGYTFDAILLKYKKGTFGKKKATSTVSGYQLKSGSVSSRALASNAVGSQNIMANAITAREIEANSITADRIASRSIVTELLAANAITADEINAGAVTAAKIEAGAITAVHISAGAIQAEAIGAGVIQAGHIASEAITTQKLAAGAVEASKIAALAVTTDKLDAGAVTAEKIGAGSINADKIDATAISAINAKLGTASIADARIALADIDYAKVKDLTAGSAYFGQAVIQAGVANKLFIPRLSVDYAQIVSATIGDLVIQATNDNYYKLDVDLDGKVTATQVTPTAEEIAAGHTSDGRTIYTATEITASELNTTDIYASHALMNDITANVINADQLFAREATIAKINAMDLSSNTYIQATIGDWDSGSTITQTIDGINTRITGLGYGTFYYSETEPSHSGLVAGDVWIEPIEDNTWSEIGEYTWDELANWTWDYVMGQYRMYVWTGSRWRQLFDNLFISNLQTEIDQNAYAITLKADQSAVDTLSGEVSSFAATLEVQAQAITAAVETVNAKTSGFVQYGDPTDDYEVHTGDTWTKVAFGASTWDDIAGETWSEVSAYTWDDLAGAKTYVWNGTEWILISDQATEVDTRTLIEATDRTVTALAEETLTIGGQVWKNTAQITVNANAITQEVARAQNAENGKIAKTTQLQTADQIVSEAVSQSASSASGLYISKTTQLQTADAIVSAAVSQAASAAAGSYIQKTSVYQSAADIVSAAESYTNGQLNSYSTTQQTSSMISAYVTNNAYGIQSGVEITAEGVTVSGGKYVKIESSGALTVTAATFGIRSGSGETYAIWAGNASANSAPFRVKPDGTVYLTKLVAVGEDGSESEVNLRIAGLWKLNYGTVKSVTVSNGYCTAMTFSNSVSGSTSVNFKSAATARAEGWSAAYGKVSWPQLSSGDSMTFQAPTGAESDTPNYSSREYTMRKNGQYIEMQNGGLAFARYKAYSMTPSWTHSMVTAHVVNVTCSVDGYTYSTQFSV